MFRVRKKLKTYSSAFLLSSTDKFKFRFVEGINQMTFKNDDRFADENIFFDNSETVSHEWVRGRGCLGRTTSEGQRLRVGDNVDANFEGKGHWYPAYVVKIHCGKYDLQYAGEG